MGCQPNTTSAIIFKRLVCHLMKPFKAPCPLILSSLCEQLFPNLPGFSLPSSLYLLGPGRTSRCWSGTGRSPGPSGPTWPGWGGKVACRSVGMPEAAPTLSVTDNLDHHPFCFLSIATIYIQLRPSPRAPRRGLLRRGRCDVHPASHVLELHALSSRGCCGWGALLPLMPSSESWNSGEKLSPFSPS